MVACAAVANTPVPSIAPQRGPELDSRICGRPPGCIRSTASDSTSRTKAGRQRTGGQRGEQPRELRPRRIRVPGIEVIGPLEAFDGFRDCRRAPPEITDAPSHYEVDVLPPARVGENAAVRGGYLQFRWQVSGEGLAASSGHGRPSVRSHGDGIITAAGAGLLQEEPRMWRIGRGDAASLRSRHRRRDRPTAVTMGPATLQPCP